MGDRMFHERLRRKYVPLSGCMTIAYMYEERARYVTALEG